MIQFPHLLNEYIKGTHLKGLLWGLNLLTFLEQLEQCLVLGQCYTNGNFYYNFDKSFALALHSLAATKWESHTNFWNLLPHLWNGVVTSYKAKTPGLSFQDVQIWIYMFLYFILTVPKCLYNIVTVCDHHFLT